MSNLLHSHAANSATLAPPNLRSSASPRRHAPPQSVAPSLPPGGWLVRVGKANVDYEQSDTPFKRCHTCGEFSNHTHECFARMVGSCTNEEKVGPGFRTVAKPTEWGVRPSPA